MLIETRSRGQLKSFDGTRDGIAHAFASIAPTGRAIVSVSTTGHIIQAQRSGSDRWRLRAVDLRSSNGQMKSRRSGDLELSSVRWALQAYVAGDPGWEKFVEMRTGLASRSSAVLIPLTFALLAVLALIGMQLAGTLDGFEWRYLPNLVVGVALISGIVVYIGLFFGRIRPKIAVVLGRKFGIQIVETTDYGWFSRPGLWTTADGGVVGSLRAAVGDVVVVVAGLVLPIAAFATAVVLGSSSFLA